MRKVVLEFDYERASELELYRHRLEMLYSTVEGDCPGDRDFGLSPEYQDEPLEVAESTFALEVANKTEKYVPEVEVEDISCTFGEDGEMLPKIYLTLNDEYEEEDEDDEY